MPNADVQHFTNLRKSLTALRAELGGTAELTPAQRDFVAVAQAEALCDLTATLNAGISVSAE